MRTVHKVTTKEPIRPTEKHQSPDRFIPDVANEHSTDWAGRRKSRRLDRHTPILLGWPTTPSERQEVYDAWHFVAMQVLHKANAGFRFLAIVPRFIDMRTGIVRGTNADFAAAAGGCHPQTISRDILLCEKLCLFIGKRTRNLAPSGEYIVRRSLRLSLPQNIADIDLDRMENPRT